MKIERKKIENRDIDLIDMCWEVIANWKWIVAAGLLGLIIALVVCGKTYQESQTATVEIPVELNKEQEKQVDMYISYETLYYNQLTYNQKSWLMTLNPNAIYEGHIKYCIKDNPNSSLIREMYSKSVSETELIGNVMESLGFGEEDEMLYEMVSTQNLDVILDKENLGIAEESDDSLDIYVWAKTKEECEKLLSEVAGYLTEKQAVVSAQLGEHTFLKLNEGVGEWVSIELLEFQKNNLEELEWLENKVESLEKELSTTQKKAVVDKQQNSRIDVNQLENINIQESFPVKKVILVTFCFIVLAVTFFVFRYLFSSAIRVQDDFASLYDIPVIAKLSGNQKKGFMHLISNRIDKARNKKHCILGEEDALGYLAVMMRHLCQEKNINQVTFLSSSVTDMEKNFIVQLQEVLKEQGIEVNFAGNIISNSRAMEQAYQAQYCVLIEQALKSDSFAVAQVVNLCHEQNIPLAGVVIVS